MLEKLLIEAENPELSRWKNLLVHCALLHQLSIMPARGGVPYEMETLGPGYFFGPAFSHWDLTFALLDSVDVYPEHTERQIENMLHFQREDGFLRGAVFFRTPDGSMIPPSETQGFPPMWVLAVDRHRDATGSLKLVQRVIEPLQRQISWFETNRRADDGGFFYADVLNCQWESGIDDSVRVKVCQDRGRFSCVDASSHVRMLYAHAAEYLAQLGKPNAMYLDKCAELDDYIQNNLFVKETGFFHDRHLIERGLTYCALTGTAPLLCGAATKEQQQSVIDGSLLNEKRFFTPHPLPFIAADAPGFELRMWRGGSWNSHTFLTSLACSMCGRNDAAHKITEKALEATGKQLIRSGAVWEFYHPFLESQLEMYRKDAYRYPCREYLGHNPLFALAKLWLNTKA